MALCVGTIKTHWEENCPLHLRESKGHSKSITLYSPNSSQLSGIKKAWGGGGDKPSSLIVLFRGVFSPRPESQLSALNTPHEGIGFIYSPTCLWKHGFTNRNVERREGEDQLPQGWSPVHHDLGHE